MKNASQLLQEMTKSLQSIAGQEPLNLSKIKSSIDLVSDSLMKLKSYILTNPFPNDQEEINFFKKIKPQFDGNLIFYLMVLRLEQCMPISGSEGKHIRYEEELQKLQYFYDQHSSFWIYYQLDHTHLDRQYFLRVREKDLYYVQEENIYYDHLTNAPMSAVISRFYAYELFREYISQSLTIKERPAKKSKTIFWKGPKVTWIEIGYACKEAGYFEEPIETFFAIISEIFGVKIDNHTRDWQDVLSRKTEVFAQLKFLMNMAQRRSDRLNDNYQSKKK